MEIDMVTDGKGNYSLNFDSSWLCTSTPKTLLHVVSNSLNADAMGGLRFWRKTGSPMEIEIQVEHYRKVGGKVTNLGNKSKIVPTIWDGEIRRYWRSRKQFADLIPGYIPTATGGTTLIRGLFYQNGQIIMGVAGQSYCSDEDNFSYKIGRVIAFGRVLNVVNPELRALLRAAYREKFNSKYWVDVLDVWMTNQTLI